MKSLIAVIIIALLMLTGCNQKAPSAGDGSNELIQPTSTPDAVQEVNAPDEYNAPTVSDEPIASNEPVSSDEQGIEVDKNLLTVDVTYPASLVGDSKDEFLNSEADGIKEVKENDDGSITLKLTKAKYNEMMDEAKRQTKDFLDNIVSGGDFKSIKKVSYDEKFSDILVEVDRELYESSFDGFVNISIGITTAFYQVFEAEGDVKVVIKTKDTNTDEIFHEYVFPDDLGTP